MSSPPPQSVLTGFLTVVLISQLKIALESSTPCMSVPWVGPDQARPMPTCCGTVAESPSLASHAPPCNPATKADPLCSTYTRAHTHSETVACTPGRDTQGRVKRVHAATMVKCLIRITTRVNVHLRMINHCYRDVKVRVLSLGPRMLGKALGVLPLYPALTGQQESASVSPLPGTPLPCVRPDASPGKRHGGSARGSVGAEGATPFLWVPSVRFSLSTACEGHFIRLRSDDSLYSCYFGFQPVFQGV